MLIMGDSLCIAAEKIEAMEAGDRSLCAYVCGQKFYLRKYDSRDQAEMAMADIVNHMLDDVSHALFYVLTKEEAAAKVEYCRQHSSKLTSRKVGHGGS